MTQGSLLTESAAHALAVPVRRAVVSYIAGLAPVIIVWMLLVGWLAAALYERGTWSEQADEATVKEWLDEARNFRKTLPEMVREYQRLQEDDPAGTDERPLRQKREEILEHMRSLAEPTRSYASQLPSFPEIYTLEVRIEGLAEPIRWKTSLPRPRASTQNLIRTMAYSPGGDGRAEIRCDYRLHAFNRLQQRAEEQRRVALVAGALLAAATLLAVLFVRRFLERERAREMMRLTALAEAEHTEREAQELKASLLQRKLEAESFLTRAAEAEKATLAIKSQLYASIGIMAGSYAHNIKNLLVRPNDLIARCLEADGLAASQQAMLGEVQSTLGTVTDRLQQILRTVRRDDGPAALAPLDLAELIRGTVRTWAEMSRDKWKLHLTADVPPGPAWIDADLSHLQQAIENLLFNARDATFEMRNRLREAARTDGADAATRKARLIDAAGWKGEVRLSVAMTVAGVMLRVSDNGVGMTPEVQANCLRTHFTTKRDNALYEGYSAGMGLGLSFVAMVLDHHKATLAITSTPGAGAEFAVTFPLQREPG